LTMGLLFDTFLRIENSDQKNAFKKIFNQKNVPQARCLMKQNAPQARLIKRIVPQARFFD